MTEEERQKLINSWMESKHAGLDDEAERRGYGRDDEAERRGYGRDRSYLSEGLLELEANEMLKYRDMDLQRLRAENNSESFNALRDHYMQHDGEVDYKSWMERTDEFNEGSDKTETFWQGLFSLAKETGDMSVLENVPEKFPNGDPTHLNNPAFQSTLETAKNQTMAQHQANIKAAEDSYRATFQSQRALEHSLDKQLAKSGDPEVLSRIAAGGLAGPNGEPARYSEAQQTALYDSYFKSVAEGASTRGLVKDFVGGNGMGLTAEEYDRGFQGFITDLEENLQNEGLAPEEMEAQLVKAGIERSVVNNRVPKTFKDRLMVGIRNPKKFQQAAEFYDQFEAQLPGFIENHIGDKQSMLFETYGRLLDDTGSEQGAMAALEAYQYGLHKEGGQDFQDDRMDAIEDAVSTITDKPWSVNNYEQTARINKRVAAQVNHYIDMGYDLDEATDFAVTAITRRSTRVGDYLYELDAGWGPEPLLEHEWAVANAAAHAGTEPEDIRIVPHPNDPKSVLIQRMSDVLPGSGQVMAISDISNAYKRHTGEVEWGHRELAKVKTDEQVAVARQRAFERMFPPNPYGKPGDRAAQLLSQKKQWAALPMSERNRLIAQEYEN
jgi:hypothetical protein